jgi:hypothetical protein
MGRLGPRFRARDIAGKIALVYAVALRPLARDKFGAVSSPYRTGRGKALNKDPFGHAYLHS